MKIWLILEKFSPVVFPWLCKEDITSVGHAALVDGVEGHDRHVEEHLGGVAWTQWHGYHGADQTPHTSHQKLFQSGWPSNVKLGDIDNEIF